MYPICRWSNCCLSLPNMRIQNFTRNSIMPGLGLAVLFWAFSAPPSYADFSAWQELLGRFVEKGLVNYSAIREDPSVLNAAVVGLEGLSRNEYEVLSPDGKKAFWINAYNIGAIKVVMDHYPLRRAVGLSALRYPSLSIQQIPGVWDRPVLKLLGQAVSLNVIENEMLRKEFRDPRVHFAIVCASLGCPVLRGEAYVPVQLEAQLDDQVRGFVRDPRKVRFDAKTGTLYVSPIFKWFKEDFASAGGMIVFLRRYLPAHPAISDDIKIQWLDYDWSLNAQSHD